MEKKCFGCKKIFSVDRFTENDKIYSKCHTCRLTLIKKNNICGICGIRAKFNKDGITFGIRCSKHKEPEMVDVINKKCIVCQKKRPNYNNEGEKVATHCATCKEPEMVNVVSKRCIICKKKQPTFNKEGESIATHCATCKEPQMVDIKSKKCIICQKKRPTFNKEGESIATHCATCKEPEMVNVVSKRCIICQKKIPTYNKEGESIATHCAGCKEPKMVNVTHKRCIICQKKLPSYNKEGESIATHCATCKEPKMVNVVSKRCIICKKKKPTFNKEGESIATHCATCKEPKMVNVRDKKCIVCQKKLPVFNREEEKIATHCSDCKEPEMVNIKDKKCKEEHCRKIALYAQPGVLPEYCSSHKQSGMIMNPRRRCSGNEEEDCKEFATHGIYKPIHCEEHALPDEYLLTERECPKCRKLDILNENGICVNFCSQEEKDQIRKKQVKKKEEYIRKLLSEEIDLKTSVIETWEDKVIDSDCTKKRPDFVYHCGKFVLISEVDEGQHRSYTNCGNTKEEKKKGENRRMLEISQIFIGIPVIWIRYNPDSFKDKDNKSVKVGDKIRQEILVKWIKKCIRMEWANGIHVKYLFYDGYDQTDVSFYQLTEKDL